MAVYVRNATIDDVEQILGIWQQCGLSPWPRNEIEGEIGREGSIFLVASNEAGGDIFGFILGRLVPSGDRETGRDAEIYNVGVTPNFRNCGTGSSLLNALKARCLTAGVSTVWLEVRASNETAIRFYRRHGFIDTGTRKSFYREPVEDALVMSLSLGTFL